MLAKHCPGKCPLYNSLRGPNGKPFAFHFLLMTVCHSREQPTVPGLPEELPRILIETNSNVCPLGLEGMGNKALSLTMMIN